MKRHNDKIPVNVRFDNDILSFCWPTRPDQRRLQSRGPNSRTWVFALSVMVGCLVGQHV